jgi:2-polyprenyl-3-methyl-5-hydroxy-6-metoxy-1,4-benzoquinol methylase
MAAWKTFRAHSDENKVTAEYLLGLRSWPKKKKLTICDIGCADGQLLGTILKNSALSSVVNGVRLVDPDKELLEKASNRIKKSGYVKVVESFPKKVESVWPKCAEGSDVVLAVHVVYLITEEELKKLIVNRPPNAVLYVVLDAPDSVFTELWAKTAPKYHKTVLKAHAFLQEQSGINTDSYVNRIRAKLPRELLIDHDFRPWLLSILCYTNMHKAANIRKWDKPVRQILDKHTDQTGKFIECKSVCYEFGKV